MITHASLSRRNTAVPTPIRDTSHWVRSLRCFLILHHLCARYVVAIYCIGGVGSLLCDPGSELLPGRERIGKGEIDH